MSRFPHIPWYSISFILWSSTVNLHDLPISFRRGVTFTLCRSRTSMALAILWMTFGSERRPKTNGLCRSKMQETLAILEGRVTFFSIYTYILYTYSFLYLACRNLLIIGEEWGRMTQHLLSFQGQRSNIRRNWLLEWEYSRWTSRRWFP